MLLPTVLFCLATLAPPDTVGQVITKIKAEAMQHSQVMATAETLIDRFGPRLTGSTQLKQAQEWCVQQSTKWGFANAHLEAWGTIPQGWQMGSYSVEMTQPNFAHLMVLPQAWSPGTDGTVTGQPIIVEIEDKGDFAKWHGKLNGKIVMNGRPSPRGPRFKAPATRLTSAELAARAKSTKPGEPKSFKAEDDDWKGFLKDSDEVTKFFSQEHIAALISPSESAPGTIEAEPVCYNLASNYLTYPAFTMSREHYGRVMRLIDHKIPVDLSLKSDAKLLPGPVTGYNFVAEIPGSDPVLKKEVVMMGGHLDSWHAATGATDNAAGCVAIFEALRILKAVGAHPKRTIRIAFWGGEEQDYYGSGGYVKAHFGDPTTGKRTTAYNLIDAYLNLDNGHGRIRGIDLQNMPQDRAVFKQLLQPFASYKADTVTTKNSGSTDHMVFAALGIPAYQFIQDPLDYDSVTHHTTLDVYEELIPEDLKVNAAIMAGVAYGIANRTAKLPR